MLLLDSVPVYTDSLLYTYAVYRCMHVTVIIATCICMYWDVNIRGPEYKTKKKAKRIDLHVYNI